jgi:hypothetical protein
LSQTNFAGPFVKTTSGAGCAGNISVTGTSPTFTITDAGTAFNNCNVIFTGGSGYSISLPVTGPVSLGGTVN